MSTPSSGNPDNLSEKGGISGVWNVSQAALTAAHALQALQRQDHLKRNVATNDGSKFHLNHASGIARFGDREVLRSLPGIHAIGCNGELFHANGVFGEFALALSGSVNNGLVLKEALVQRGCLFQSNSPAEPIGHLIAISLYSTWVDRLIDAAKQVNGDYSLIALEGSCLLGA